MTSRLVKFLSVLAALSCLLAAAAPLALADSAAPDVVSPDMGVSEQVIAWTPPGLTVPIAPGETEIVRAVFTSRRALDRAMLVVSFPLNRYVRVEPHDSFPIAPGLPYNVELTISLPDVLDSTIPAVIVGFVHVMSGGRVYGEPLMVTLVRSNTRPPVHWTPPRVRLAVDWPETTAEEALPASTVVSFTTSITIENARLRATAALAPYLDMTLLNAPPSRPLTLTPGITYTLALTAHQRLAATPEAGADDSADAAVDDWSSGVDFRARKAVQGLVEIFDARRVYPHSLAVEVLVGPVQAPPVIEWRPPFVSFILTPGEPARRVVTVTSDVTVPNATFQVTGPITRFVSIAGSGTPVTLLPRTPHPVTLVVTSPLAPTIGRTLAGTVVVVDSSGRALRHELKVMLTWQRPRPTPVTTP